MSKRPHAPASDPEALGDPEDDPMEGDTPSPVPPERAADPKVVALEAKIAVLQAQLAKASPPVVELPMDPDALIDYDVPLGPTGQAVEFNGQRIVGRGPWKRRVLDHVLHVLSAKQQSERERLKDRGVGFPESRLDPADYGSRAQRRRQGRHVL